MHDPKTVSFEIYLGSKRKSNGNYKSPLITIWHNDPEIGGSDDSCGWCFPKITKEENEYLDKVVKDQYPQMLSKYVALSEGKSYADICYNQDTYGIIYWMWRIFNKKFNSTLWQYGESLSAKELNYIYELATNPVDNFQHHKYNKQEVFREMIYLIYRCWKRFNRKWYQHPKWHIHHWSIQFHPLQNLKRRYWDKCCKCGKRGFKSSAIGDWNGTKLWHQECDDSFKVCHSETGQESTTKNDTI